jgi:hypothetical protein
VELRGSAQAGTSVMGTPTLRVSWQPLDARLSTADAIKELDRRVRDVMERFQGGDDVLAMDIAAARKDINELEARIAEGDQDVKELVRHAAIEGLVTEAWGLLIVTAGAVLQGLGSVVPA